MLAARDNKHNIVEKLLELGAVVTDRDKVGTEFRLTSTSVANATLFFRTIFLITQEGHQKIDLPFCQLCRIKWGDCSGP